ncbi:MAG: CoB--CoM heterodisulfide reductase iron-sulfur subunit A family protein [Desulfobacteraceae bacterium]|nr:MAG: CoB--CoM heterodisulfide reductase iron-sulfur subunit A family protein [Desulfobacteraceae bacterium]
MSEVIAFDGQVGHFKAIIKKHPRYIRMEKCIACGACAEKCPKKVPDEYNMGLNKRKSAYIKYGQAVPLKYAIDGETCIYLTRGKCRACEKFCPTGAINFDDREETRELQVGSAILAPGYTPFDPSGWDFYGYGRIADVVTSIEYERLLSAGGPHMGHLVRPSDMKEPRKVAWIQCVGSRNTNRCQNGYCSSVCCMYAIKQMLITAEHAKEHKIDQTVFYMDIRSPGKEFERYYESAKAKGIRFLRSRPHTVEAGVKGNGVRMRFVTENGDFREEDFDLAVLSVGLTPAKGSRQLAEKFGIDLDEYGFAYSSNLSPVHSSRAGVYVTGAFQAPKAIPRSVTQASAAAAAASGMLQSARGTLTRQKTYPAETDVRQMPPRIGVFICSCGINIAGVIDVKILAQYAQNLPDVALVENNLFTCSADTQDLIAARIRENGLNRIVIAACTPRTHEPLFQDTLSEAGLNPYLVEMANIRNQNAWVHQRDPELATAKAKDQLRMAVAKAALADPLRKTSIQVTQKALVIGGGVAGMTAALGLAEQGYPTVLLEKSELLGGNVRRIAVTAKGQAVQPWLENLIARVRNDDRIEVLTGARIKTVAGSVGSFVSDIEVNGQTRSIAYGAAVLATGGRESRPDEYLHGQDPRVLTHLELDDRLMADPDSLAGSDSIAFIQCVGSRDSRRPYCSRICCTHTVQTAIRLKERHPQMQVFVLFRDMRTYGKREELYKKARDLGVLFIRHTLESKPRVSAGADGLSIRCTDPILQAPLELKVDHLILAAAVEPNPTQDLVELFKCGFNADGFLTEAHPKLRPVDMSVDGLFLCGMGNYPQPIEESLAQAQAAVARACGILARKEMQLDAIKSEVTEKCDGCALCLDVCPYKAIRLAEEAADGKGQRRLKIVTDPALCKGCGLCAATCPKGGVYVHGFTLEQLRAQVVAALSDMAA